MIKWVGIDVSKNSLDVHTRPDAKKFTVENNSEGIEKLIKKNERGAGRKNRIRGNRGL